MRVRSILATVALVVVGGFHSNVSAQACSTANDYECPAGTSTFHALSLSLFGPVDMSVSNRFEIGAYADGSLAACYHQLVGSSYVDVLVQVVDANGGTGAGLHANSFICGLDGSDTIGINETNTPCGSNTLFPFVSNGRSITIFGNDQADAITTGGAIAHICGGPGGDTLSARNASSTIDGWTGNDTIYHQTVLNASVWGYDGQDTIVCSGTGGAGGVANVNGEANNDCILVYSYQTISLTCGADDGGPIRDSTNVTPRPADCEYTFPQCPAYL